MSTMIKIRIRNADHEIDIRFPISESELFAKLGEIHAVEGRDAAQSALVTEVYWPEEFSIYAFIANRLYEYMFLVTQFVFFDFDKPLILVFCEYISMIVLFAWIGYWLKALLKLFSKKSQVCS